MLLRIVAAAPTPTGRAVSQERSTNQRSARSQPSAVTIIFFSFHLPLYTSIAPVCKVLYHEERLHNARQGDFADLRFLQRSRGSCDDT